MTGNQNELWSKTGNSVAFLEKSAIYILFMLQNKIVNSWRYPLIDFLCIVVVIKATMSSLKHQVQE